MSPALLRWEEFEDQIVHVRRTRRAYKPGPVPQKAGGLPLIPAPIALLRPSDRVEMYTGMFISSIFLFCVVPA